MKNANPDSTGLQGVYMTLTKLKGRLLGTAIEFASKLEHEPDYLGGCVTTVCTRIDALQAATFRFIFILKLCDVATQFSLIQFNQPHNHRA